MINPLKFIALAVALCLCQGCSKDAESPVDRQDEVYRAILVEGNDLLKEKKYQEAAGVFGEAVSKAPEKAGAYLNRGIAYIYLERYERAIVDLTKAIEKDEGLAIAYANRGIAYDHLEKPEEALSDYKVALALDPNKVKGPGFMERFLYNKPKLPDVGERAEFLEKALKPESHAGLPQEPPGQKNQP